MDELEAEPVVQHLKSVRRQPDLLPVDATDMLPGRMGSGRQEGAIGYDNGAGLLDPRRSKDDSGVQRLGREQGRKTASDL